MFLLQFTCASPTVAARLTKRGTHCGSGDVWVASSDGCVGQVSMLSPLREFEVSKKLFIYGMINRMIKVVYRYAIRIALLCFYEVIVWFGFAFQYFLKIYI